MLRSTVLACAAAVAAAFAPGAAPVPAGLRLAGAAAPAPTCPSTRDEPLTVVAGRGDKRTTKGKRFSQSWGKSRPRKGNKDGSLLASGFPWGQPTSDAPPAVAKAAKKGKEEKAK